MIVKTQADWWELAFQVQPKIKAYADSMRVHWDEVLFDSALVARNHSVAHAMLELLWSALPDEGYIRVDPFFDVCDLCSEYWVFEEGVDV